MFNGTKKSLKIQKGVIRGSTSKDRQYICQKNKDKRTHNIRKDTTQKTKDPATRTTIYV